MGGSGIAGDVMVAVAGPFVPGARSSWSSPTTCPDFVGRGSLVFAVSFSGDTEETVEAAGEAADAGASLVAVTSGGELSRLAEEWGAPVVPVPGRHPPAPGRPRGHGHPAAHRARGHRPVPRRRPVGRPWPSTSSAPPRTGSVRPGSVAEELARRIGRTIPLVHGAQAVGAAAAAAVEDADQRERQGTGVLAASTPSCATTRSPGWGQHGDVTRQVITLVNLRHDAEHPQVVRRFALVAEVLREVVADIVEVHAEGEGDLAQLLDLILVGDFVSLHLAAQEGIDPGPGSRCSTIGLTGAPRSARSRPPDRRRP